MKSLDRIFTLLTSFILAYSFVAPLASNNAAENWPQDMRNDYTQVLLEKKKVAEHHRKLVRKWQENGRLLNLIDLYEDDRHHNAPYYYGLGYAYAVLGGSDGLSKAREAFQQSIALDPGMAWAHFSLGGVYQQTESYELALGAMKTCVHVNPNFYLAYYKIGEIHLKFNRHEQALEAFQAAQKINRKWKYPYYGIGLVHFVKGRDNKAWEAFKEAIDRDKNFAPARFKLGQLLAKKRFFEEALGQYNEASQYEAATAETLYELGVIFVEQENTSEGIRLLKNAVEVNAEFAPAHVQLGEVYYETGQSNLALEHYGQAIQVDPTLKDFFINKLEPYHRGLMLANEAKSLLDKSLKVIPNDPRAHFYYAQIESEAGNIESAIRHYEKIVTLIEEDRRYLEIELRKGKLQDVYLNLGNLYYQLGVLDKAAVTYEQAIARNPELEQHFLEMGKSAFDRAEFNQVIEPLTKFLLIFPGNTDASHLLARSYEVLGNVDKALKLYQQTIKLDPTHTEAMFQSAQIYRNRSDLPNALKMLQKLIDTDPNNAETHYLAAIVNLEHNLHEDALLAFLATSRLAPNHVDAHYQAGLLYEQKGDIDNAVEKYESAITLDSLNAAPFFRLGAIYLKRGDKDNAIRVYEPALEIEPNHPQVQYHLAAIFEEREENGKSIKHFGLANQYDNTNYEWHFRYARLLTRHAETLENYNQYAAMAVQEYTAAAALKPDYTDAYFYRGLIARKYKQIGDKLYRNSEIAQDFQHVVKLQPQNPNAHHYLGLTLVDLDEWQKGKQSFQKVLMLDSKFTDANFQLGLIAEREQRYKEAIEYYQAEVAIDPESARVYQHLGDLYNAYLLDFGQAKVAFKKALELEPNHVPTLLNYGNALYNLNRLGAAAEQFELALQLDPRDLTANYNLALIYEYAGKKQQALGRWRRFLELSPPEQWKLDAERHVQQLQQ